MQSKTAVAPPDFYDFYSKNFGYKLIYVIRRLLVRKFDNYICGSLKAKETLNFWGVAAEKIKIIPNPIMAPETRNAFEARRRNVLLASRLIPIKNISRTSDILKLIGVNCDIYGSGPQLQELKKSFGDNCKFLGHQPIEKLLSELDHYKFFISLSVSEESPNALLDAMSRGVVPIVSKIPAHLEIVSNISNSLAVDLSLSDEKIASHIGSLLSLSKQEWEILSASCVAYVNHNHDPDKFLNNIREDILDCNDGQ
ncbi:glycosyltransferase [Roseobacter sp. HKCCA0882]|uniref:glycosyltransferase n=1 Tax=Roseobacter sp. HKCCA0882 TaxID=3120337 RepID=UPI0030EF6113